MFLFLANSKMYLPCSESPIICKSKVQYSKWLGLRVSPIIAKLTAVGLQQSLAKIEINLKCINGGHYLAGTVKVGKLQRIWDRTSSNIDKGSTAIICPNIFTKLRDDFEGFTKEARLVNGSSSSIRFKK